MNIFDAISTSNDLVTGQIAGNLFSALPEDGPALVIIDRHGHRYGSEPDALMVRNITDEAVKDLCARIDDGFEPVITKNGETTLIGSHLATDRCNYGYALLLMRNYCPVSAMANIALIETILAQMNQVARLTERLNSQQSGNAAPISWATGCLN
jgi:hypothetical protein